MYLLVEGTPLKVASCTRSRTLNNCAWHSQHYADSAHIFTYRKPLSFPLDIAGGIEEFLLWRHYSRLKRRNKIIVGENLSVSGFFLFANRNSMPWFGFKDFLLLSPSPDSFVWWSVGGLRPDISSCLKNNKTISSIFSIALLVGVDLCSN